MLKYNLGTGEYKNWIVSETEFSPENQGKFETIMALGNGYMGVRSATEESYVGQIRNLFVAGTFNQFDQYEVTELPNAADLTELILVINGEKFSLEHGKTKEYRRDLNLRTGELSRCFIWENKRGEQFEFIFRRFVSLKNLHLIGSKTEIKPLNCKGEIKISSGINAQVTNSGAQHFHEGEKRIFDKKYLQLLQKTTESNIQFVLNTTHTYTIDGALCEAEPTMAIERRKVLTEHLFTLEQNQTLMCEKISNVYTSRDKEYDSDNHCLETLREDSLNNLKSESKKGYDQLFAESVFEWKKRWQEMHITIDHDFDQLAIRFAHYHLMIMTPAHDNRFGIGAKGLSGEGYKGHSFWDTEIFILPFFMYTFPDIAKSLLEYRYNTLDGARKKAKENGYEGAMYAWESAFTGEEATPVWGAVDIITGKATKIWSGFIEQHITSDVAFAVWQYYKITGDQEFMERYGYEILFETATFWASRLEWSEDQGNYHINEVIGPDEYKEHVNNNAFTNYMAHWNLEKAISYYDVLKEHNQELFLTLNEKLNIEDTYIKWKEKVGKVYLPQPEGQTNVIAQDDTYLQKRVIDLMKYKNQKQVGSIFEDYNLEQVNNIQVSKQADIMILFLLLENKFSKEVKRANWDYYEPKTLHDSSLSLSTHSILANDMDDSKLAYKLFEQAITIDLGQNMKSSDAGIHAASLGGIWQAVVYGFGGVRMLEGKLRINAKLPDVWERLQFPVIWKKDRLEITVTDQTMTIENMTKHNKDIEIEVHGESYLLHDKLIIETKTKTSV